ncbi:hypothetical protein [Vreelandella venusta]|uniref:hypothetical protein n=1 Tax=Vreelandella venusta TaxID=44935 RepID=UPI003C2E10CB
MANATRLTVQMPARSVTVYLPAPPRFEVISHGLQGPPGTLPQELVEQLKENQSATQQVAALMNALCDDFTYYGGAMAAQEETP